MRIPSASGDSLHMNGIDPIVHQAETQPSELCRYLKQRLGCLSPFNATVRCVYFTQFQMFGLHDAKERS